ncbi:toll/interleukin-1 receptor domain-containing protein [Dictyobacter kobayashii]|uniref:TIR domain-containing protein n=1 Tax=Dictyobacter kobayashii TaxID=2014872 RepID=A0A402AQF6_9CHLR|nr:TIR domain-containing protein [Dictyobacter kobayashii]GCE21393.1 hypothetical protein KDK_51930 [Dictyobacter kobayashii]
MQNDLSQAKTIPVFFSYAPEDRELLVELKRHLAPLRRQGLIEWPEDVIPGIDWKQMRSKQFEAATILVLLLSPNFIASDDCYNVDLQKALKRQAAGTARIAPILLKPVDLQGTPFTPPSLLPENARPVTSWPDRDEAFQNINSGVRKIIHSLQDQPEKLPGTTQSEQADKVIDKQYSPGDMIFTYDVHARWVSAAVWSPDGKHIASGGGDGIVHIWESATGHNVLTYRGHATAYLPQFWNVWDVEWSPDGRSIASCGQGETARVWDAKTGKDIVVYNHQKKVNLLNDTYAVAWSPDGACVASATWGVHDIDQTIHVWNAETGSTQAKYAGHAHGLVSTFSISDIAWSPDGHSVASCGTDKNVKKWKINPITGFNTVQIWDPKTGKHKVTCHGYAHYIYSVAWSPNSKYLAAAQSDKTVSIWEAATGDLVFSYKGHTKEVRAVAWSPDDKYIASSGNDHTVHIWKTGSGKLIRVYRGHSDNVTTLAWSPDGSRIASAGSDHTVQIWQAR